MLKEKIDVLQSTSQKPAISEEMPYELVPLPSEGRLYPEGHPLHGEDSVQIKAMSTIEEDILTSKALIRKGTVVSELMKSCLINKSIDPDDLLIGDKSAILVSIRIGGFDKIYTAKTTCPECDDTFDHPFDLSKCLIKRLGIEPINPGENLFGFKLPHTGREVKFKLLTAGEESDITKSQEMRRRALKKSVGTVSEVDSNVSDRLTKCILSIDSEKDKIKLAKLVREMPSLDSRPLRKFINDNEPDIVLEQEVKCPHCGVEEIHDIPMGLEFLWPKR